MDAGVLFSTPGIHDPRTVTQKGKPSCGLTKKLTPQESAGTPTKSRKPREVSVKGNGTLALPSPQAASWGAAVPFRPVFQVSLGLLRLGRKQFRLSPPSSPGGGHPLPLGPGLFANNGGNIKQGRKTGSESLTSQTASLEGAGQREGPGGAGRKVPRSSYPTTGRPQALPRCDQGAAPRTGEIRPLNYPGHSMKHPRVPCSLHQAEAGGETQGVLLSTEVPLPPSP